MKGEAGMAPAVRMVEGVQSVRVVQEVVPHVAPLAQEGVHSVVVLEEDTRYHEAEVHKALGEVDENRGRGVPEAPGNIPEEEVVVARSRQAVEEVAGEAGVEVAEGHIVSLSCVRRCEAPPIASPGEALSILVEARLDAVLGHGCDVVH